jgi:hypothetical protein
LQDRNIDGRIILKWILEEWDGGHGLDRSASGEGQVAGSCESSNKPSAFIKSREFLDWLSICWLLRKASAPWSELD